MKHSKSLATFHDGEESARATACRHLAVKAERQAEQTRDPDMRSSFLSMKDLWLDLANEIDRRQSANSSRTRPQ